MVRWKLCDASNKAILATTMDDDSSYSSIPTTPIEAFSTTLPSPPCLRSPNNDENDDACGSRGSFSHFFKQESNSTGGPTCLADVENVSSLDLLLWQRAKDTLTPSSHVVEAAQPERLSEEDVHRMRCHRSETVLGGGSAHHWHDVQASPCYGNDTALAPLEAVTCAQKDEDRNASATEKVKADHVAPTTVFPSAWQHAFAFGDELRRLQSQVLRLEREQVESKQHQEEMASLLVRSTVYMEELKRALQEESCRREYAEKIIQDSKIPQGGGYNIQDQSSNAGRELDSCLSLHDVTSSFGKCSSILVNTTRRKNPLKGAQTFSPTPLSSASVVYPKRKPTEVVERKLSELKSENACLRENCELLSKQLRAALLARDAAVLDQQRCEQHVEELESALARAVPGQAEQADSTSRALAAKTLQLAEFEQQLGAARRAWRTAEELRTLSELSLNFVLHWLACDSSPRRDGDWGQEVVEPLDVDTRPSESVGDGEGASDRAHDANAVLRISEPDILARLESCVGLMESCAPPLGIQPSKLDGMNDMKVGGKEVVEVGASLESKDRQISTLSNATLLSLPQYEQSVNRALAVARMAARRRRSANQAAVQNFFDSCLSLAGKTRFEFSNALEAFSTRLLRAQKQLQQVVAHCAQREARDAEIETQLRSELKHTQERLNQVHSRLRLLQIGKEGVERQLAQLQEECLLVNKLDKMGSLVSKLQSSVGSALCATVSNLQDIVTVDADSLRGPFLRQIQAVVLRGEAHLEQIDRFLTGRSSDPSSSDAPRGDSDGEGIASAQPSIPKGKQQATASLPIPTSWVEVDSPSAWKGEKKAGEGISSGRRDTVHNLKRKGDSVVLPSGGEGNEFHEAVASTSTSTPSKCAMTPRQMSIYYHMKHLIHASPSSFPTARGLSPIAQRSCHTGIVTPSSVSAVHLSPNSGTHGDATQTRPAVATLLEKDDLVQGAKALARQLSNLCKLIENSTEQSADHARNIQNKISSYEKSIKNAIEKAVTMMLELLKEGVIAKEKGAATAMALSAPSPLVPEMSLLSSFPPNDAFSATIPK